MISHLSGTLAEKDLTRAVIDVGGVGFEVLIPMSTYDRLPREGEPVVLHTHLSVREDALTLFGFATAQERQLYLLVTGTVTGIGPKLGLSILSCMSVDHFCAAVVNGDVKALSRIQGVGKRSAERMVVELKDKIEQISPAIAISGRAPEASLSKAAEDAVAGLVTLGFAADQARKVVRQLIEDNADQEPTAQQLIRKALANRGR